MNLKITSKFDPFTYEELSRPIVNYNTAYRDLEEKYDTLEQNAATLETVNGKARQAVDEYRNALNTAVEDFSQGMSLGNKQQFRNLKKMYNSQIIPIATAEALKQKEQQARDELQLKAAASGDRLKFKQEILTTDDFLGGKTPNNEAISYSSIVKETSVKAAALAQSLMSNKSIQKSLQMPGMFEITTNNGITPEMLFSIFNNNTEGLDAKAKQDILKLQELYQGTLDQYADWDADAQQLALEGVQTGMYAALNKPTIDYTKDLSYTSPADNRQLSISEAREAREQKAFDIEIGKEPLKEVTKEGVKYQIFKDPITGVRVYNTNTGLDEDKPKEWIESNLGVKASGVGDSGKATEKEEQKKEQLDKDTKTALDVATTTFGGRQLVLGAATNDFIAYLDDKGKEDVNKKFNPESPDINVFRLKELDTKGQGKVKERISKIISNKDSGAKNISNDILNNIYEHLIIFVDGDKNTAITVDFDMDKESLQKLFGDTDESGQISSGLKGHIVG